MEPRARRLAFSLVVVSILVGERSLAQVIKISAPFPPLRDWDVQSYSVPPGGEFVVYSTAGGPGSPPPQLHSAKLGSGGIESRRLDLGVGEDGVRAFEVSALHQVFFLDGSESDGSQLFRAPADGSSPAVVIVPEPSLAFRLSPDGLRLAYLSTARRLLLRSSAPGSSPTLLPFSVKDFAFTPAGERVVYRTTESPERLLSAPSDGATTPVVLSTDAAGNLPRVSPDGRWVIFGGVRLQVVPADGSQPSRRLSAPEDLVRPAFSLSSDSKRVVYVSERLLDGVGLYGARLDGSSPPARIDRKPVHVGDVTGFEIAPDSQQVVFVSDQQVDETYELYRAPIGGERDPVRLSGALVPAADVSSFRLAGHQVLYAADQELDRREELWQVALDGKTPALRLSRSKRTNCSVTEILPVPLERRVVYLANHEADARPRLYSVLVDGGAPPVQLNPPLGGQGILDGGTSLSAERAFFLADLEHDAEFQLYEAPLDGSVPALRVNGPLPLIPAFGGVHDFRSSPDGGRVLYRAVVEREDIPELYGVVLTERGRPARLLNGRIRGSGLSAEVQEDYAFTPDGSTAVYRAPEHLAGRTDLYSVPIQGGDSLRLNLGGNTSATVSPFEIVPGSQRVLYTSTERGGGRELLSVPHDGSEPPTSLSGDLPRGTDVGDFRLDPGGERVAYHAGGILHSVLADASAAPIVLHAPAAPRSVFAPVEFSADGQWVLHLVSSGSPGDSDFYSVPSTGGAPPIPLPSGIAEYRIAPVGNRIVFRRVGFTLHSVPLDGSSPAVLLSSGTLRDFAVSPDGARAVYTSAQNDMTSLYSVPIDGSAAPVTLMGPVEARFLDTDIVVDPSARWVVYRTNLRSQSGQGLYDLFVVPLDGSQPPRQVNPLLTGFSDVPSFQLSPDGAWIAFLCDPERRRFELYLAPVDGHAPAEPRNAPLQPEGSVSEFTWGSTGRYLLYSGDGEQDRVAELFLSPMPGERPVRIR